MRSTRSNGSSAAKPKAGSAKYHVVKITRAEGMAGDPLGPGDALTIVAADASAKSADAAMDSYVETLDRDQRVGEYGALLIRNFKAEEYLTETVTVTRKRSALPTDPTDPVEPDAEVEVPEPV